MKEFTNLYQLSKTLRFELKPIGKTAKTFQRWLEEMNKAELVGDNDGNLFLKDKKIQNAYLAIKPIMDKLHEQLIEMALLSKEAKQIDFSEYFEAYKNKAVRVEMENGLRKAFAKPFQYAGLYFVEEISKSQKNGKEIKTKKDKQYECLTDAKMYNYLSAHVRDLAEQNGIDEQKLKKHIEQFKGFWGYLDGYNQNRENYYEVDKEASTAVATRIVHENLPTFCSNAMRFEKRKDEYLCIYRYLKDNSRETKIKNTKGEEIDVEAISDNIFQIKHFNECLAQSQIEEYNRIIGNYNMLINLYNQLRRGEKDFKKIDEFEKLKKQIGCGKKKSMFETLQGDSDVKKLLLKASEAGKQMFKDVADFSEIKTVPDFIEFLRECDNWDGIYMSKTAIDKISSLYFANWHSIKDKLKEAKADACITYEKKREEPIKLRDAVELSGLFAVLDSEQSEHFFKDSLFKDDDTNDYRGVLNKTLTPSKNLIQLLCFDIERNTNAFLSESNNIVKLEKYKDENDQAGEEDQTIRKIKEWFDAATDAMRIVRYFSVRKSKMKGNIPNATIEQALSNLLYNDDAQWFKWYDLIRNYLTKKPQDDAKENKLKLNFGTSSLLGGWSDGQEKTKAATLLKYHDEIYLCVLKTKNIFDTSKDNNPIYNITESEASRLLLRNLKFQTLAGKGFLGEYEISYGDMGKDNPTKAIKCLQKIIKERYVNKYPLLEKFARNTYTDKAQFDAEITETLKECYVCQFVPIDWNVVTEKQDNEELFLFKILCKDYRPKSVGKKDLQTMYWEDVLSDGSKHQLCAGAEIFMREPVAKESPIIHRIGSKFVNKRDKDGDTIPEQIYREIYSYANGKKKTISAESRKYIDEQKVIIKDVKHKIIKDNRFYGETKYMFHCPIKLQFEAKDPKYAYSEVNTTVSNALQQSDNLQFIGIDRGEKHLVYSCIVDKDCKILKCGHHDVINGTDYVQKLEAVAGERIVAKKNWQQQNKIRDLKNGYISHVVHRLVEETIKDNGKIAPHAYIVLEDLNTEMKRGRQKIEKQVYQNLETALAKKLNFVVDKDTKKGEIGSVSKALQLTPPINNYQDIEGKKQFGVMLYTRANYTSVTDPATGWRKTIYIKNGKEDDIKNQILDKFSDFGFDGDYYFEYTEANVGHTWRLYSGKNGKALPRFQNKKQALQDKNVWVPEKINVVDILNKLFAKFDKKKSFKSQIEAGVELQKDEERNETAWQSFRFALDLIQQIRNSGEKNSGDDNFLYSPVRNDKDEHFDTRNYKNNGELSEIRDADANGAYNIARKGLIMDTHIKHWINNGRPKTKIDGSEVSDLDLFISDREWDLWLLDREQWMKELPTFASKIAKYDSDAPQTAKRRKKR